MSEPYAKEGFMKSPYCRFLTLMLMVLFCGAVVARAQEALAATGTTARLIVTVEPRHGASVPAINRDDVMVYEGHTRDTVTGWTPAQGEQAALELFILIDD